jgi:hypothetical protein
MRKLPVSVISTLCFIGLALAVEPPAMKEGLWSIHTQSIDNPGNVKHESSRKICRSHAYDKEVQAKAKNLPGCKVLNENLSGGTFTSESECTSGQTVIKTKGTTTFQGDTATHSETHATYTPALYGVSDTRIIMDQKYLGACPAGTQPGDIIQADGTVTHTRGH